MQKKREQRELLPEETYTVKTQRDAITGIVVKEQWFKNGLPHREGGPASIWRDPVTGVAIIESWWKDMKFHREDGPAFTLRKPDGRVYSTGWYLNGEKISRPRPVRLLQKPRVSQQQPNSNGPGF